MKTVDHFIKSLSCLNEKKFFEISRNVLGDVKTPYHRQTVIKRLVSCISNAELQEVLFSYITEDEALIINAVEMLDGPCLHDIHDFLATRFSYTECIRFVILLEERLVLYSYVNLGQEYYALNPVFEDMLKPILDNKGALFPHVKKSGMRRTNPSAFTVNKMFLFAFFSYVHAGKIHLKVSNELTKKTEDQAMAFFQDNDFFHHCFFDLLDTALYLDLLSIEEKACILNLPALERFLKLPELECRAYFVAGMCGNKNHTSLVMDILAALSPGIYYTPPAVHRMLMIILREAALDYPPPTHMFFKALQKMGLLIEVEDPETEERYYARAEDYAQSKDYAQSEDCVRPCVKDDGKNDTQSKDCASPQNAPPSLVFDAPFSFVILPHADITAVFDVIHFSSVENIREYRFTVSRETVVRCLESAVFQTGTGSGAERVKGAPEKNAAWIVERLKALSGDRLDETLAWTINEWEKRFGEVILHEGLVLYLDKERRYLAETASLKPYLEKALSDDVFIINPVHRETVEKLLAKSGVDIIGKVRLPSSADKNSDTKRSVRAGFPSLPKPMFSQAVLQKTAFSPAFFTGEQGPHEASPPAADYRKQFRAVLASLDTTEAETQELLSRIDRGLIFCEEQLKKLSLPGTFPYEKNKARGMDYSGKLLIAKNAFVSGIPVEITWQTDGKERSMVCTIARLEKNHLGDMLILYKDGLHGTLEIPLGKVSVIKRIKQSIFE
ncbi:MAG: hypothetical protein LBT00_03905 [Spirochaetaceae bacterium]|jgi:hypothetical protein|nr:hypothetical protein [Spirochaetaceae bacterium]